MGRFLLIVTIGVLFLFPVLACGDAAVQSAAAGDDRQVETAPRPASPEPAGGRLAERERRLERQKRFALRTLADLRAASAQAEEDIGELAREIDAITVLEPSVRERDLRALMDWYYDYADWLSGEIGEFDADLAQLSAGRLSGGAEWQDRFGAMVQRQKDLLRLLNRLVKGYDAEQRRLAGILERRRELENLVITVEERRARIEEKLRGMQRTSPDRAEQEQKAERLRGEVTVIQNELLSLPTIDQDILKHYAALSERGRGEGETLSMAIGEYEALWGVAGVVGLVPARQAPAMQDAYERVIRAYESEIGRVARKIDEFDRRRSRVTPAGSLRELDRSAELADYYLVMKQRCQERLQRLKTLVGDYQFELSDISAGKDE